MLSSSSVPIRRDCHEFVTILCKLQGGGEGVLGVLGTVIDPQIFSMCL